ncbi:hypothetical protein Cylst_3667 [Cylindrospermum stagnale PCC 7417]|uniref:Uncharacterized protein n=1 Tax=Cylindrospermum stagnale PCC 7417 TaxID=56107 RepID=K9X171_9NOST|nr:hypothetical protein [Cylindrospermum stagnale]AFZ25791.1 hypothetical protein Cylst_3667 [Cylindrospermum stagnale PCC 7417]
MTSRADEIQKLIADIDNLLASSGKRLSRLLSGQAQEPREVLQQIRGFLVRLVENEVSEGSIQSQPSGQPLSPLLARFVEQGNNQYSQPNQEQSVVGAEQLNSEFSALFQPLQAELSGLLQERATLIQEIRQLEQRRLQNYSLTQQLANQEQMISEFLQVLMSRLVPSLTPHLTQDLAISPSSETPSQNPDVESAFSTIQPFLESPDLVERLAGVARELDLRLRSLDGTVNVVFDALQGNINTYHQSLSQALARMHSQGVQGEQLMASFFNNLTQYLQLQSPDLQPSLPGGGQEILPLPSLVDSVQVQPANSSAEVVPLQEELIQLEDVSSIAIPPVTEDLDAVLLQLGADQPPASDNAAVATPTELASVSSELIGDEVDQLYASLFGNNDSTNPSLEVVTNELSPLEVATLSALISANNTALPPTHPEPPEDGAVALPNPESTDLSKTHPEPPENAALALPDPWLNETDVNLLDLGNDPPLEISEAEAQPTDSSSEPWSTFFFTEDTQPQASGSPTDSLPVELDSQPASIDTITFLTDLLVDVGSDQQRLEVSNSVNHPATETSAPLIHSEEPERPLDNYIPASPQENLLSLEQTQLPTISNIFLDEEQLQQLDRDLANFDQQLNSFLEPTTNSDSFQDLESERLYGFDGADSSSEWTSRQQVENISTDAFSGLEIPQQSADLDFSPKIEKKKEVIVPVSENTWQDISNSLNNSEVAPNVLGAVWYLGIDLGTTGISAALMNRSSCVVYPIYWSAENQPGVTSFQQSFRLPAEVYLPTASVPHAEMESIEAIDSTSPAAVAQDKIPENKAMSAPDLTNNLYSAQLKPYLQVAIPYKSTQQKWEPVLQLNDFSAGPLIWVVRSLSKLLLTLKSDQISTTPALIAAAIGIDTATFSTIINQITGVICTCPSSWSEQYRFNVREAVLTSKLVSHPQQVFFIEEAIASLLPELDSANAQIVQLSDHQGLRLAKTSNHPLLGNTLTINIGATATEMALVDLPENLGQLAHNDFMLHGFAYAGKGIEQDIICQLLLPPKSRQSRLETQADSQSTTSNPWQWQPAIPGLDEMHWHSLGLEALELPRVGEPDPITRIRLQQRLESSLLGQAVLDASLALKLILQHQDSFTLELADQRWILQRRDLESQVFVPFVRRLNRELNKLLVARGIPTEAINQAILTGGVASIGTVNRWLRQKLPNAKIIQDSYLGDNGAPICSRVAYGLAMLPLHPQVLEVPRQQYSDYFLFTELLRLLPERPLSFSEVLQLFEGRGINTRTCQQRLLAFLEGELPPGLVPSTLESTWLTQNSQENSDYKAIAIAPLFEKQGSLTYRPNSQQLLTLRHYLDAIKASTQQSLEEPYTVNFVLEADH